MSSSDAGRRFEIMLLFTSMVVMTLWYAWPQILYSSFFFYDLGLKLSPGLVALILDFVNRLPNGI